MKGMAAGAAGGFAALGLIVPTPICVNLVQAMGALEVLGGLLIVVGLEAYGAALIALFLACVTPVMHNPVLDKSQEDRKSTV